MASWKITVTGKGVQKRQVEAVLKALKEKFGDAGVSTAVEDASPPESRADRFAAAAGLLADARAEFEALRDELQEWHDNLRRTFQSGSKADEIQEAIDALDELVSEAEDLEGREVSFRGMY